MNINRASEKIEMERQLHGYNIPFPLLLQAKVRRETRAVMETHNVWMVILYNLLYLTRQ